MEDQLVSYRVAVLAKEKGVGIKSAKGYCRFIESANKREDNLLWVDAINENTILVAYALTQSLLQKYLREKHGIEVFIHPTYICKEKMYQGYYGKVKNIYPVTGDMGGYVPYEKYEDALESALLEALKLID